MLVEILQPGDNLLSIAINIPFNETKQFVDYAMPKLGRFQSNIRWRYDKVDGDRVCLTAVNMIKPWQSEFLTKLEAIAVEYQQIKKS